MSAALPKHEFTSASCQNSAVASLQQAAAVHRRFNCNDNQDGPGNPGPLSSLILVSYCGDGVGEAFAFLSLAFTLATLLPALLAILSTLCGGP